MSDIANYIKWSVDLKDLANYYLDIRYEDEAAGNRIIYIS